MSVSKSLLILVSACVIAAAAQAAPIPVNVTITGVVEYNQIVNGALGTVVAGQPATLSFTVDATNYLNNPVYPTRGYPIDPTSFHLSFPTVTVPLQNPFPAGQTPYFVIRHNDPQVDGFFISTNLSFFDGVPLNEVGYYGNYIDEFHVTYQHGTLSSLNILDAAGTYNYAGLTVFNWAVQDGPFDPLYIDFSQMTITPEPAGLALVAVGMLLARRRR